MLPWAAFLIYFTKYCVAFFRDLSLSLNIMEHVFGFLWNLMRYEKLPDENIEWSTTLEILNLILAGQSVSGLLWQSVLTFWWQTLWEHFRSDNSTNLCCAQFWKFYKTFQRNHWDCPHCKGWQEKLILVYIHKEHLLLQWLVTCYLIRETKG